MSPKTSGVRRLNNFAARRSNCLNDGEESWQLNRFGSVRSCVKGRRPAFRKHGSTTRLSRTHVPAPSTCTTTVAGDGGRRQRRLVRGMDRALKLGPRSPACRGSSHYIRVFLHGKWRITQKRTTRAASKPNTINADLTACGSPSADWRDWVLPFNGMPISLTVMTGTG